SGLWVQAHPLLHNSIRLLGFLPSNVNTAQLCKTCGSLWFFLDGALIVNLGLHITLEKAIGASHVKPAMFMAGSQFYDAHEMAQRFFVSLAVDGQVTQVVLDFHLHLARRIAG